MPKEKRKVSSKSAKKPKSKKNSGGTPPTAPPPPPGWGPYPPGYPPHYPPPPEGWTAYGYPPPPPAMPPAAAAPPPPPPAPPVITWPAPAPPPPVPAPPPLSAVTPAEPRPRPVLAPPDWDVLTRDERRTLVLGALESRSVETLWDLTQHNLMIYGRGGSNTSAHTLRGYRTGVMQFLQYAYRLGWERMTIHDTDLTVGYIRHLERENLQPGTINSRRSAARAFYRALRWAGVLSADPFADTPRAQDPVARWDRRDAYSREDVAKLLKKANARDRLMILLGAHGALRISEVLALTWDRVNLDERTIRVTGKGNKTATVHMSAQLYEALSAVQDRTGHVCGYASAKTLRSHLRALCLATGVRYDRRQFHGLRHASATMLLQDTNDLFVVMRHLRHSSVGTTEIYAKFDSKKLQGALTDWGSDPQDASA